MKTLTALAAALLSLGLMFTSCQKDNSLAPDDSFSQTLDLQNPDRNIDPKPGDIGPIVDPISNYPDPFTESTTILFRVTTGAKVSLVVYNDCGQRMATLVGQYLPAGEYRTVYNAKDCPCGTYRAVLKWGTLEATEEMTKAYSIHADRPGDE